MRSALDGLSTRLGMIKERIREFEDMSGETSTTAMQVENNLKDGAEYLRTVKHLQKM